MFKQTLRRHLEKNFSHAELECWFDPLSIHGNEDEKVIKVAFPHHHFGRWFMESIRERFERTIYSLPDNYRLVYEKLSPARQVKPAPPPELAKPGPDAKSGMEARPQFSNDIPLHEHFLFDTFLVNRKNDFPFAAAKGYIATAKAPAYTPFLVYGQSGAGKSHLLGAMANSLREKGGSLYIGGTSYLERISLASNLSDAAVERYVFIDDVQKISASAIMQETLAAVIDLFQASGRLLALSCDVHPAICPGFGKKLRTRLSGGLVVELKSPDLDIRRQYVQQKNIAHGLGLSKTQVLNLSHRYHDIRSIDGALARLMAFRQIISAQNNEELSSLDLESFLDRGADTIGLSPAFIIKTVAREFSLPPEEITGKKRGKNVSLARQIALLLCRELLGISLIQTGRIFAGRDHSSVLYSIKKIKQLQASNRDMNKRVEDLRKLCLTKH